MVRVSPYRSFIIEQRHTAFASRMQNASISSRLAHTAAFDCITRLQAHPRSIHAQLPTKRAPLSSRRWPANQKACWGSGQQASFFALAEWPGFVSYCAHRTSTIQIDPSKLACFSLLEGHPCWSTCGRRTRPFSGRAFREHRTNVSALPILSYRARSASTGDQPGCPAISPEKKKPVRFCNLTGLL